MAYDIHWDILKPIDFAGNVWRSFDKGRARADKDATQRAASAFARDPGNQEARAKLYGLNPALAAGMEDQAYEQSERRRTSEFRGAYGDYLMDRSRAQPGPVNALSGVAGPPSLRQPTAFGAAPDAAQAAPAGGNALLGATSAFAPVAPPARPTAENALLPSMTGQNALAPPMPVVPPSFERMVRADPEKFLTFEGRRLDMDEARLKQMLNLSNMQMQLLGGVHDDASLQRAKEQARQLARQFDFPTDAVDAVPDTYTPELVRSLQMQGMDTTKQLLQVVRENKLDWDIEDDQDDNERADRNTNSQIGYRDASIADRRERTRIARERPAGRGATARTPAARAPSKSSVIGGIMAKQVRGERLTPAEEGVMSQHGGVKYPDGTVIEMPNGDTKVVRGGRLVSE
jgi:hypothetical protein